MHREVKMKIWNNRESSWHIKTSVCRKSRDMLINASEKNSTSPWHVTTSHVWRGSRVLISKTARLPEDLLSKDLRTVSELESLRQAEWTRRIRDNIIKIVNLTPILWKKKLALPNLSAKRILGWIGPKLASWCVNKNGCAKYFNPIEMFDDLLSTSHITCLTLKTKRMMMPSTCRCWDHLILVGWATEYVVGLFNSRRDSFLLSSTSVDA